MSRTWNHQHALAAGPPIGRRRLEVCVDDVAGLLAAVAGGADRIELCSALALGGLTPSYGLMAVAAEAGLPIHVMIRPRSGDFQIDPPTIDLMRRDIDAVRRQDLAGVVFGASLASGALDTATLDTLADHAKGLDCTLHRAFDLAPDREEALEAAVALGFDRILTSGGSVSALAGVEALTEMVDRARNRLVVMPGGGVNLATIGDIVRRTGAREVHASCSEPVVTSGRVRALGMAASMMRATSRERVAALVHALRKLDAPS